MCLTSAGLPLATLKVSAVLLLLVAASTSAPSESRNRATSYRPAMAAMHNGVYPSEPRASTSAPAAHSRRTMGMCPEAAATCKAVYLPKEGGYRVRAAGYGRGRVAAVPVLRLGTGRPHGRASGDEGGHDGLVPSQRGCVDARPAVGREAVERWLVTQENRDLDLVPGVGRSDERRGRCRRRHDKGGGKRFAELALPLLVALLGPLKVVLHSLGVVLADRRLSQLQRRGLVRRGDDNAATTRRTSESSAKARSSADGSALRRARSRRTWSRSVDG